MKVGRFILRAVLALIGLALLVALVGYLLVSASPGAYKPQNLSAEQQELQVRRFVNHINAFGEGAGAGEPFEWKISAQQVNSYLASMDAIASLPANKPVEPSAKLAKAGLTEPAVAFENGVMTIMARSTKYDKVFSADVVFAYQDGSISTRVQAVRVGLVKVPESMVQEGMARVNARVAADLATAADTANDASLGMIPMDKMNEFLHRVVQMIDGQYVRPEVVWPLGRHRVLIDNIDVRDGWLTLHAVPVARKPKMPKTAKSQSASTSASAPAR
jgi:hypothetical protein